MNTRTRLYIGLALLAISVTTLIQALTTDEDVLLYAVTTTISHVSLLAVGFWYAKGAQQRDRRVIDQIKQDILR